MWEDGQVNLARAALSGDVSGGPQNKPFPSWQHLHASCPCSVSALSVKRSVRLPSETALEERGSWTANPAARCGRRRCMRCRPCPEISISRQGCPAPVALASPGRCWVSLLTFFRASGRLGRFHHLGFQIQPWTYGRIYRHCFPPAQRSRRDHAGPFSTSRRSCSGRGPASPSNRRQLMPVLPSKSHFDVLIVIDTQQQIQPGTTRSAPHQWWVQTAHDGVFPTWCLFIVYSHG